MTPLRLPDASALGDVSGREGKTLDVVQVGKVRQGHAAQLRRRGAQQLHSGGCTLFTEAAMNVGPELRTPPDG